jgi:hypothetical protein
MENNPLNNYHSILLSQEEVKEIFRLGSDRSLRDLKKEYGLRKRGRHYLTKDVRRAIHEMEMDQAA